MQAIKKEEALGAANASGPRESLVSNSGQPSLKWSAREWVAFQIYMAYVRNSPGFESENVHAVAAKNSFSYADIWLVERIKQQEATHGAR